MCHAIFAIARWKQEDTRGPIQAYEFQYNSEILLAVMIRDVLDRSISAITRAVPCMRGTCCACAKISSESRAESAFLHVNI